MCQITTYDRGCGEPEREMETLSGPEPEKTRKRAHFASAKAGTCRNWEEPLCQRAAALTRIKVPG